MRFLTAGLFVVPVFLPDFWTILLFTGAALMFWSALGPFTEAVILYGVREHGIDYPRVRLLGSVGFMLGSLVAAAAVQRFAGDAVIAMLIVAYISRRLVALISPRVPAPPRGGGKVRAEKGLRRPDPPPRADRRNADARRAWRVLHLWHALLAVEGLRRRPHRNAVGLQRRGRGHHLRSGEESRSSVGRAPLHPGRGDRGARSAGRYFPSPQRPPPPSPCRRLHGATLRADASRDHDGDRRGIHAWAYGAATGRLPVLPRIDDGAHYGRRRAALPHVAGRGFPAAAARLASLDLDRANGLPRGLQPQSAGSGGETKAPE